MPQLLWRALYICEISRKTVVPHMTCFMRKFVFSHVFVSERQPCDWPCIIILLILVLIRSCNSDHHSEPDPAIIIIIVLILVLIRSCNSDHHSDPDPAIIIIILLILGLNPDSVTLIIILILIQLLSSSFY